jgi:hypothetical protein
MTTPSISSASLHSKWCAPLRWQASTSRNPSKNHIYEMTTQAPRPLLASGRRTTRIGAGMTGTNARGERRKRRKTRHSLLVPCFCPHRKRERPCDRNIFRMLLRACKGTGLITVVRGCGIGVEDSCAQGLALFKACSWWFVLPLFTTFLYICALLTTTV